MKTALVVLGIILCLAFTACNTGQGTVIDKHYKAGYSYWAPSYTSQSCDEDDHCIPVIHDGHMQYVSPVYSLTLHDCSDQCQNVTVDVSEDDYDSHPKGSFFSNE